MNIKDMLIIVYTSIADIYKSNVKEDTTVMFRQYFISQSGGKERSCMADLQWLLILIILYYFHVLVEGRKGC